MRAIAEFLIDSTYCLAEGQEEISLANPKRAFEVKIRNNPKAGPFAKEALIAEMLFETPDLDAAKDIALDLMAVVLNALGKVTGGRFEFVNVTRIIDWTPGLIDRQARYFIKTRAAPSSPFLDHALAGTAERVMAMFNDEVSQTVLRWYRLGMRAQGPEEQFMYLWFAIEVTAGAQKEPGKIAVTCPKCQSNLFCQTCDSTPTRRRFETEAIKDLIWKVSPPNVDNQEIYETLIKIRNTLHHGRRLYSILHELPCTVEQALHVTAQIAWRGITHLADNDADPRPEDPLTFIKLEDVINRDMVVGLTVETRFEKSDPNAPKLSDAPAIEMNFVINEKNYSYDGREVTEQTSE